jgi:hypothetical protein
LPEEKFCAAARYGRITGFVWSGASIDYLAFFIPVMPREGGAPSSHGAIGYGCAIPLQPSVYWIIRIRG